MAADAGDNAINMVGDGNVQRVCAADVSERSDSLNVLRVEHAGD